MAILRPDPSVDSGTSQHGETKVALSPEQIRFLERYVLGRALGNVRDAEAPAPDARQKRQDGAAKLLRLANAVAVPPGATQEERGQIAQGRGALSGLLTETATDRELRAAAQLLLDLQKTAERISLAVKQRATEDRLRRENEASLLSVEVKDLVKTIDKLVPESEAGPFRTEVEKIANGLTGAPSDQQLSDGRKAIEVLRKSIEDANLKALEALKKRIERAAELELAASKVKVDHAAPDEKKTIERLAVLVTQKLPVDRNQTTDGQIKEAETALQDLSDAAKKIAEAVDLRLERVKKAAKLLDDVKFGEGTLKPADGAPPGKVAELSERAKAIPTDHAKLRDPDTSHEWGDEALQQLANTIDTLAKDVANLNKAVAKALEDLHRAAQAAEAAITSSAGAKLSSDQQDALRKLITPAVESAEKDTDKAAASIEALGKTATRAAGLAKALGLLTGRIGRVAGAPAEALPSELLVLSTSRKAADEAIAKVEP